MSDFEVRNEPIDVAVQAAAVLAVVLSGILILTDWPRLPDSVPVHFGAGGLPDAWGSKRTLLILPGLALAILLVLTLLERTPRLFNYPWPITPENAQRQYAIARRMMISLKAVVAWTLAIGFWRSCAVAAGQAAGLGTWFLPASLLAILGTVAIYFVQGARAK